MGAATQDMLKEQQKYGAMEEWLLIGIMTRKMMIYYDYSTIMIIIIIGIMMGL